MGWKAYAYTVVFCVCGAVLDEVHQTFVPGRGGQISDTFIDTAGATLGIGVYWVYCFFKVWNKNRSS